MTFGVPNYPGDHYNRGDSGLQPFMLGVEMLLKNGTTVTLDFDIADQMRNQPRGGVLVISDIDLSKAVEGGFGVGVDDWAEIDIPLDLNK